MSEPRPRKDSASRRDTVTFRAYYWEAYNEIVQPRAIGRYLIRRWLPDLGTNGYAIVQVLRDRAYHNPGTGELRNDIFVESMAELARACGMSESTLRREFTKNRSLAEFVRKAPAYQPNRKASPFGRNVEKAGTVYWIAMDDPIHPLDEARYQQLKQKKELEQGTRKSGASGIPSAVLLQMRQASSSFEERATEGSRGSLAEVNTGQIDGYRGEVGPEATTGQSERYSPGGKSGCQNDGGAGQNDSYAGQNDGGQRRNDRYPNKVSPSSPSLSSPPATAALSPKPNGLPPEGAEGAAGDALCRSLWEAALPRIAQRVNKPTFETHIRTLVPVALSDAPAPLPGAGRGEENALVFTLGVPSPFTREWVEKRHAPMLNAVLSEVLEEPVTVNLMLKSAGGGVTVTEV